MPYESWTSVLGFYFLFPLQFLGAIALFCISFPPWRAYVRHGIQCGLRYCRRCGFGCGYSRLPRVRGYVLSVKSGHYVSHFPRKTEHEMRGMAILWEQEKQQYKMTKDRVDLINIKCHDMKKYIEKLRGGKVSDEELNELQSLVSLYDRAVHTGNEVFDVLLADKGLSCEREGIRLSCMVDGGRFDFMSASDLYSLFGNILDNAVAATSRVVDTEKRVISITSSVSAGMLFLHEENYYEGDILMEDGVPKTGTGDEEHHGFGTRSIVYIARKYDGEARFAVDGQIFSLDIVIPLPKES